MIDFTKVNEILHQDMKEYPEKYRTLEGVTERLEALKQKMAAITEEKTNDQT
jgi:hypothetical protein